MVNPAGAVTVARAMARDCRTFLRADRWTVSVDQLWRTAHCIIAHQPAHRRRVLPATLAAARDPLVGTAVLSAI